MRAIQVIRDAFLAYEPSVERFNIPTEGEHVSHPQHVRMSSLDGCPLDHAYSKNGYEKLEHTKDTIDVEKRWLFKGGEYAAMVWQEALLSYASKNDNVDFRAEEEVIDRNLVGRADGLLTLDQEEYALEIKYTKGFKGSDIPPCRLGYAFQCISYMRAFGTKVGIVLSLSKYRVRFYYITKSTLPGSYVVYNEDGTEYSAEWNNVITMSDSEIDARVSERLMYMRAVEHQGEQPRYVKDPQDHYLGWMCLKIVDKGNSRKNSLRAPVALVNCSFADMCYNVSRTDKWFTPEKDGSNVYFSEETLKPGTRLAEDSD